MDGAVHIFCHQVWASKLDNSIFGISDYFSHLGCSFVFTEVCCHHHFLLFDPRLFFVGCCKELLLFKRLLQIFFALFRLRLKTKKEIFRWLWKTINFCAQGWTGMEWGRVGGKGLEKIEWHHSRKGVPTFGVSPIQLQLHFPFFSDRFLFCSDFSQIFNWYTGMEQDILNMLNVHDCYSSFRWCCRVICLIKFIVHQKSFLQPSVHSRLFAAFQRRSWFPSLRNDLCNKIWRQLPVAWRWVNSCIQFQWQKCIRLQDAWPHARVEKINKMPEYILP